MRNILGVIKLVKYYSIASKFELVEKEISEILNEDLTQSIFKLKRLFSNVRIYLAKVSYQVIDSCINLYLL